MPHVLTEESHKRTIAFSIFDTVLERGLELTGAAFGNIQTMNWQTGCLEIAVQRGFQQEFLKFFERVGADDQSVCAHALRVRGQVFIEDVSSDKDFSPLSREIVLNAGVCAVLSTPIVSSSGAFIGMLSTHYPHVHMPSVSEMEVTKALAREAANAVISIRARQNETQMIEKTVRAIRTSRELLARVDAVPAQARNLRLT